MTSAEEFNCILCKETFHNKDELQIHFRKHGDPKFNESIKAKSRVQNEATFAAEKSNEASEMVNCDVCDEVFPTISKAITHKHKVHPDHDAKYFCPWCGKLFTMKHLYNKHLHANHDATDDDTLGSKDSNFHCNSCNVYFFIPAAMVYHNKFFHRQDTDLPIIGHSKKQKLVNQDLLPVYYCSFCGEEYINKVNLHKHMCDEHGDENQRPTDVLRCPLCEAVFYHLDAYELHLTFHTSQDLYSETNEMNEIDMTEFSLETVPPVMERIEDLNNLPDVETDINTVGIESFLQMAMDEPKDSDQLPDKARSKKHKKHKKSKKPAITLDEFLSMNQDVFGEDLDFQGIEEVPTKVITKQLKIKKPLISKKGSKVASSAELQKLQKLGIAVKVQSGNNSPISKIKPKGQPIKVNPQVKNLAIKTKPNAISASNEVLSKLLNQSSSQLIIVKKSTQEKEPDENSRDSEFVTENLKNKTEQTPNSNENEENCDDHKSTATQANVPQTSPTNEHNSSEKATLRSIADGNDKSPNIQTDNGSSTVISNACTKPKQSPHLNYNEAPAMNNMSDTFKNIGKQITIKALSQTTSCVEGKPDSLVKSETNASDVEADEINADKDNDAEKNEVHEKNKAMDTLKNISSAITIKTLKNISMPGSNINRTTDSDKTEKNIIQSNLDNPESSPIKTVKLETIFEGENKFHKDEPSLHLKSSSQVLKNISKNITIKSMSAQIQHSKKDDSNDEYNDTDFDNHEDDLSTERQNSNHVLSSAPDRLKNLSPTHKLNSDISIKSTAHSPYANNRAVANSKDDLARDETCTKVKEFMNANMQSSSSLLKHLTNITAKPIPTSKIVNQDTVTKLCNTVAPTANEINVKKPNLSKDVNHEIEIFNIDDSEDEEEQPISHKLETINIKTEPMETTHIKKEPVKVDVNSHTVLNAIKNMSKHITVKPSNKQIDLKMVRSNEIAEHFSDDDIHNDEDFDFDDDLEPHSTAHIIKTSSTLKNTNKNDSFNNVLKQLGKHITVKSKNVCSNQSTSYDDTANDAESDEESYTGKVKITEITEGDDGIDHTDNCNNDGIVTHSPDNSINGDEHFETEQIEETDESYNQNLKVRLNHYAKPSSSNEGLLKSISKNITVKSLIEKTADTADKTCKNVLPEIDSAANNTKLCKESLIKPNKQTRSDVTNDNVNSRASNMPNDKRINNQSNQNLHPKPSIVNTVNKAVKVKTFQSETVIEEITTTVTKTIRRVNQTVNQVYNASQMSSTPRMIKPQIGPRMTSIHTSNKLQGVTVRQSPSVAVRPKIRQAVPLRPVSGTTVRPSNQLVPIRPGVTPIRPTNAPRMQVKNMPRQPRPVGRPLKISPNVVNQTLKRPVNEETPGHFSCFKKQKESLIPLNEDPSSTFQCASSSQISKFCSTTQTVKGNSVVTSTQIKSESSQQQHINKLGNIAGLKVAKASQVCRTESSEMNASKRTTLEAIEKLQKQGLLIKKPRVEEPYSDGEDNEEYNDDFQDYDDE